MIGKNVKTDFNARVSEPVIDPSSYVHPLAAVIGNVILGKNIMVSPTASLRGDEGQPIYVGDDSLATSGATQGIKLAAGASRQLWMNSGDTIYAISAAGTGAGLVVITASV